MDGAHRRQHVLGHVVASGDDPDFNAPSYRISKTALNMATAMLAKALAHRASIKVVALCPGWVQTDMGGSSAQITRDANRWPDCCG